MLRAVDVVQLLGSGAFLGNWSHARPRDPVEGISGLFRVGLDHPAHAVKFAAEFAFSEAERYHVKADNGPSGEKAVKHKLEIAVVHDFALLILMRRAAQRIDLPRHLVLAHAH